MPNVLFDAQFIASKLGKTGLTPTVNVYRRELSNGTKTQVVTNGAASETGNGIYAYLFTNADLRLNAYTANFHTVDTSVDQRDVAARAIVIPDELVSSRASLNELLPIFSTLQTDINNLTVAVAELKGQVSTKAERSDIDDAIAALTTEAMILP